MRTRSVLLLSLLLAIAIAAFVACAPMSPTGASVALMTMTPLSTATAPFNLVQATQGAPVPGSQTEAREQEPQAATTRVILRSASLRLIVADPDASLTQMTSLTTEYGGWVVNSSSSRVALASGGETTRATLRLRVPADRLDEALASFKEGAVSVDSEVVTGEDVTQDYVDVSSRLTNLEAAEAQLRQIMDDAVRTQDVLDVYNELVRTRGEIEVLRGRLNYYDEAASFSLVTVDLVPQAIQQPVQIAGWSPGRTAENAIASLLNALQGVADFAIRLVIIGLPLLVIASLVGWSVFRIARRFIRRQPTQGS